MTTRLFGQALEHHGWPYSTIYSFRVNPDDLVIDLRDQCAEKLQVRKTDVELWKLKTPVAVSNKEQLELIAGTHPTHLAYLAELMNEGHEISELFRDPGNNVVFVISPLQGSANERKRKGITDIETKEYVKRLRTLGTPSDFGKTHEQTANDPLLLNHRPAGAAGIPTELLHEAFGHFRDNRSVVQPEARDVPFTVDLCRGMSRYYQSGNERVEAFKALFQKSYGIDFYDIDTGKSFTEATVIYNRFCIVNIEGETRLETGCDPSLQTAAYYARKISEIEDVGESRFPMILIYIAGSRMGISAAIFGSKVTIDPLETVNLAGASRDLDKLVAVFATLRIAMEELAAYYNQATLPTVPPDQRQYPYYNRSFNGEVDFAYEHPLLPGSNLLIFLASGRFNPTVKDADTVSSFETNGGPFFVVKFSRQYGTEAHRFCADAGIAPKVYHVENLAGGWTVIVMELIGGGFKLFSELGDEERAELGPKLQEAVATMHNAGYVHGDLRRANVFGNPQTKAIRIVDWDRAGREGNVHYPLMAIPRKRTGIEPLHPISKAHDTAGVRDILAQGPEVL